jgi:hypothetical protein
MCVGCKCVKPCATCANSIKVGDRVCLPGDWRNVGRPGHIKVAYRVLSVLRIEDYVPIDGPRVKNGIIWLSDGTWEFAWNLSKA